MRGADYADLKAFRAVAEELSFTRAARRLGVTPSSLSQTIRGLEDRLGVRLFNRTTRSVALTDPGRTLSDRLAPVFSAFEDALAEASAGVGSATGRLRLNMPHVAARHLVGPGLAAFTAAHPGIVVELAVEDRLADIVAEGFDAGIRLGERLASGMVALPLGGTMRMATVAAPAYLDRHGAPLAPEDLGEHRCIRYRWPTTGTIYHWEFDRDGDVLEVAVDGPLIVNDTDTMLNAALTGLGVAYLLEIEVRYALERGDLVEVLAGYSLRFPGFYLYHSSRRLSPPPLRAFIDFFAPRAGA